MTEPFVISRSDLIKSMNDFLANSDLHTVTAIDFYQSFCTAHNIIKSQLKEHFTFIKEYLKSEVFDRTNALKSIEQKEASASASTATAAASANRF